MLGSVAVLEERIVQKVRPVPHLRLVAMPKVTYIGELYEAPRQQHPQERALAEVIGVEGMADYAENGIYAIKVNDEQTPRRVFLSTAHKITSPLPKRDDPLPTFGRDEVTLEPHPIRAGTELHERISRWYGNRYRKSVPDTAFDFV